MPSFVVRVVLHKKDTETGTPMSAYSALHTAMEKGGFKREIDNDEGAWFHMPHAEYYRSTTTNYTASAMRAQVKSIIEGLFSGRKYAVLAMKVESFAWTGLAKV